MFSAQDELEIQKRLSEITQDVKILLFVSTLNCETCPETEALLRALEKLSDWLHLEVLNPYVDREQAERYQVDKVPAIIIEGDRDYGIRYFGIPGGYEFAGLLEDIISVGKRDSGLSEASREKILEISEPLNIKVFVTPG